MMNGTNAASQPRNPNRLSSALYAPMQDRRVFRPMAISVIISEKPNVSARIRYTSRKIPPPYRAAR